MWRLPLLFALVFLVAGCLGIDLPSQTNPVCSWNSQPPSNADQLCRMSYQTVDAVARAEARGDDATIRRLVARDDVALRIIKYGAQVRAKHLSGFHAVPSITLAVIRPGLVGARFYLVGKSSAITVDNPVAVYLRIRQDRALIAYDFPRQVW